MRDDFNKDTIDSLAKRVGFQCSNPACRCFTIGPKSGKKSQTTGVAAHITAASPKGPRYDSVLSSAERKSIHNAIWLCQNCAKLIDNDNCIYTVMRLMLWKNEAETSQFLEHTQITTTTPTSNYQNEVVELFRVIKKVQQLYDYFYSQYETAYMGMLYIDEIIDYLDRYPQIYHDSLEKQLEQLNKLGAKAENLLIENELYLEQSAADLYNEYFLLGRFKYQHDFIGLHNDYIARFFENVRDKQKRRLMIVKKIETKTRSVVRFY